MRVISPRLFVATFWGQKEDGSSGEDQQGCDALTRILSSLLSIVITSELQPVRGMRAGGAEERRWGAGRGLEPQTGGQRGQTAEGPGIGIDGVTTNQPSGSGNDDNGTARKLQTNCQL